MKMNWKQPVRRLLNTLGLDVVRFHQSPARTLLGLAHEDIRSVIDVGANCGQFAQKISEIFPQAEIWSFEPLPEPFQKLSEWAKTQNGRVKCFNVALGDSEGEVEMHLHTEHSPSSSLLQATDRCHALYPQTRAERNVKVRLTTLDQMLSAEIDRMPRDILLKLDVQGYEDRVLRGAYKVLSEVRACILEVCLDPLYVGQADFFTLSSMLHEAGLRYAGNLDQVYGKDGHVIYLDAVFVR